jgi:acyl carrier protein
MTDRKPRTEMASAEPMIAEAIGRVVGALAPDPRERVRLDEHLVADLGYDSLRTVELSFTIEELFQLDESALGDAPSLGTVQELVDFIAKMVRSGLATMPTREDIEKVLEGL